MAASYIIYYSKKKSTPRHHFFGFHEICMCLEDLLARQKCRAKRDNNVIEPDHP